MGQKVNISVMAAGVETLWRGFLFIFEVLTAEWKPNQHPRDSGSGPPSGSR
jgi:hypothetical protein